MRIQDFDYSVDLLGDLLWEYDGATNLVELVNAKQDWYNEYQSAFWGNWYDDVFNLLTANTFGLSVWSFILNIPLFLLVEIESPDKPNFGFNAFDPSYPDLENSYLNFQNSNFSAIGSVISLTNEQQRFILRLRYYQLSCRCDVTDVNVFLNFLISTSDIGYTGTIYMLDHLDMSIEYVFTEPLFPPNLLAVIKRYDVLPRPAGVGIIYTV